MNDFLLLFMLRASLIYLFKLLFFLYISQLKKFLILKHVRSAQLQKEKEKVGQQIASNNID
jgi:hypothetical protein